MKKIIVALLVVAILASLSVGLFGCADEDKSITSGDWKYIELEDGTISLVSYVGTASAVVVPPAVDGKTVSQIEQGLFLSVNDGSTSRRMREVYQNNELVRSVTFAAPIKEIPARTFYMCAALEWVALPDTCESIGDFAFYGCSSLTAIELPTACKAIGAYCFRQCEKLQNVYIHNAADATLPPKLGDKCFFMVNNGSSKDDQYYVIPDLKIWVDNISVFDENVIKEERKKSHTNDYKYWLDYMPDEDHKDRNYIFAANH